MSVNRCNVGTLALRVIIVLSLSIPPMGSVKLILFLIRENFSRRRVLSLFAPDVVTPVRICDYGVNMLGARSGVLDATCMTVSPILKKVPL